MSTPEKQSRSLGRSNGFHPIQYQFTETSPRGLVMKAKWEQDNDLIPIWSSFFPSFRKGSGSPGKQLSIHRHSDVWGSGSEPRNSSQAALDPNLSLNTHWLCGPGQFPYFL